MFGYVKIWKDELRVREYTLFKAYYCGLCKALGKRFGQLTRLGLSYDMTFLALVLSAVHEDSPVIKRSGCLRHTGRRPTVTDNPCTDYAAAMSVLLAYEKLRDDWHDDHSVKALFGMLPYLLPMRRVRREYPTETAEVKRCLGELASLEKERCGEPDRMADCFGNLLKSLFSPDFAGKREDMANFGFLVGRWIYLIDAYADLEEDREKKRYNPYLFSKGAEESAELALTYLLAMIGEQFEKIPMKNREIIANIIYLGMRKEQEKVMKNGSV